MYRITFDRQYIYGLSDDACFSRVIHHHECFGICPGDIIGEEFKGLKCIIMKKYVGKDAKNKNIELMGRMCRSAESYYEINGTKSIDHQDKLLH